MKQGGRNPSGVSPYVQSVLEMKRFYDAGNRTVLASAQASPANANNTLLLVYQVPQGRVALIEAACCT